MVSTQKTPLSATRSNQNDAAVSGYFINTIVEVWRTAAV